MARRKAVAAVEKDEEVRVTRTTRSRAAQAAQQAPPSPPPPPPAPRGRATTKSTGRKRKPSVSSDRGDELATKKANTRTSPSPAPPVNRGRKTAIKNARGRRKAIASPTVSGSNSLGDEMDVEEPENVEEPPVKTERESSQNLPMEEDRENVEVEAEVKKPRKTRKAPPKKRGVQKKVAVPGSGIHEGEKRTERKFDGPQIEVEVELEMSATDEADDEEASAVASSMLVEDKTDTPPSSFLVQEDSNRAIEDAKEQVEEPEKIKKAPARKRGAKKVEIPPGSCRRGRSAGLEINKPQMEVASEPAELKAEASEETTATNVEKPKAKRGRKPNQKAAKKGGKKAPAVKAEAEEEASVEGLNIEGGNIQEGSLEEVKAEGATADNNIISEAGAQGEKDEEIRIEEAPVDQATVEETITNASADTRVTGVGEASVQELKADAAVTEEAILEGTAVSVALFDEPTIGGLTVENTAFDKAPEIEIPMAEEEAKADGLEVEEAKVVLAETEEVAIGESVVEEAALEHVAVEDAIVDKPGEAGEACAEEAQMVEEIVEAVSVEVGAKDSNTEEAIVEGTTSEPKAAESEVCEAVEEEVAFQRLTGSDVGDIMEDVVDDPTTPTGVSAESASGETDTTTSIAVEPVGDDTVDSIAVVEAENNVPEGETHEDEGGRLSAVGGTKDFGKASSSVVNTASNDVGAEIKDRCHALSSLKRKAKGRLSEPATGKVEDFEKVDASHKRRSTGEGLPLPKRRRVTPPPMQPPSTSATISPSPRKAASPSTESTPRSTGPLTTPVKPLGPFLMPPATPEAVAGIGRSPTKGSTPLKLVSGEDDGTMVVTTETARRQGQEMAHRHLQQYQGVFERLRANFEVSEGFQQAYQGVMRRAFSPPKRSPGRAGLPSSSPLFLPFDSHGLDDGDDSFDRSFDRAVSPDRSSIIWAWDIEHEGAESQEAEGESDGGDGGDGDGDDGDDEDEAGEVIADPLSVEEKASIAIIMDAPRDSNILEPTEVQEVVMSDRLAELELAQELDGAEKLEVVAMTLGNGGEEAEEAGEAEEGGEKEGEEKNEGSGDRGDGLLGESEGPETEDQGFESGAGYPRGETEDSRESEETEIYEGEAGPGQGAEEPEVPAEAQSLTKAEGSVGTWNQAKPSRLRIPATKALKLSKAPRIPVPASRVAAIKMRKVSVASLKDVPISRMTPHELASTTNTCTARNKLYSCDFTRRVIHKNTPRPPSPNAKVQTLKASQDRARRRAIQEETGVVLGPGDEENFDPNPSSKVRWGHPLESQVDYEEQKSPSQIKELLPRPSILSRSAQLNRHGNVVTPPTEIVIERTKVTINKILYRGEKK